MTEAAPAVDPVALSRARGFVRVHTIILLLALVSVSALNFTGLMTPVLTRQSVLFCASVGALTAIGGWVIGRARRPAKVVVAMLYGDSIIGLVMMYSAGEFETPALSFLLLCVMMAPMFAGRREAVLLSLSQWLMYSALLVLRQTGVLEGVLSYAYMLPKEAVQETSYVLDCWISFTIAVAGTATLAGQASQDILNSTAQLEREVGLQTQELAKARDALSTVNDQLEATNGELGDTNRELQLINQRLEQFNTAVSHDLRAPLQAMMARAELISLALPTEPDRIPAMSEQIIQSAERMSKQLDELMKLSRVGERLGAPEGVDLGAETAQVIADLGPRILQRGVKVSAEAPLPTAWGNGTLLREAVQNLVENAIKYGDPNGPVVLVLAGAPAPGRVELAVEDNGPGVPEADANRIFRLFERLQRDHRAEGVGAGLAIVRRIVEVHGGGVRVERGQRLPGARFVLELPAPPA